jgi:hypothetical protein
MKQFEFRLNINPLQYQQYYLGAVSQVVAQDASGATIQFPAALLQRFVTANGVRGRFVLNCDDDYKNSQLKKLT